MLESNRDGQVTADLVDRARGGDELAWREIVLRYRPLVLKIATSYRLMGDGREDVAQMVWTRLVEHIDGLRDPRALPGWIATTTTRICMQLGRQRQRSVAVDMSDERSLDHVMFTSSLRQDGVEVDHDLIRAERRQAVRRGLAQLTTNQQKLLLMLVSDPPLPYTHISREVGMPVGSIGPTRARLLKKLRHCRPLQELETDPASDLHAAA